MYVLGTQTHVYWACTGHVLGMYWVEHEGHNLERQCQPQIHQVGVLNLVGHTHTPGGCAQPGGAHPYTRWVCSTWWGTPIHQVGCVQPGGAHPYTRWVCSTWWGTPIHQVGVLNLVGHTHTPGGYAQPGGAHPYTRWGVLNLVGHTHTPGGCAQPYLGHIKLCLDNLYSTFGS